MGLGLYEANVGRLGVGRHTLRFHDAEHDKLKVLHQHQDYPAEYRLGRAAPEAFRRLDRLGDRNVLAGLAGVDAKRPIADPLSVAAILCLIASILLRRL